MKQGLAVAAFVIELAGVRGHGFLLGEAAARAGEHGLKDYDAHRVFTSALWRGNPRS